MSSAKLAKASQELEEHQVTLAALRNSNRLKRQEVDASAVQLKNAQGALSNAEKRLSSIAKELADGRRECEAAAAERLQLEQTAEELGVVMDGTLLQLLEAEQELQDPSVREKIRSQEAELALLKARVFNRETHINAIMEEMARERAAAQNERETLQALLASTCQAHDVNVESTDSIDIAMTLLEGLLSKKAAERSELLFFCNQLLSEREGLAVPH